MEANMEMQAISGYYHNDKGELWYRDDNWKEELISSTYIKVIAMTRSLESDNWGLHIEFVDKDGNMQEIIIKFRDMPTNKKEMLSTFADEGFNSVDCNNKVIKYLLEARPSKRITTFNYSSCK